MDERQQTDFVYANLLSQAITRKYIVIYSNPDTSFAFCFGFIAAVLFHCAIFVLCPAHLAPTMSETKKWLNIFVTHFFCFVYVRFLPLLSTTTFCRMPMVPAKYFFCILDMYKYMCIMKSDYQLSLFRHRVHTVCIRLCITF